ncbi:MAG TPA: hypothetical protein VEI02_08525 [Planctomycetota bacterium]|nr:hypothetical protein [Planctomycetota bacterium]
MRSPVVVYGLIPGLIAAALTTVRAWLEVNHPASAKFLSVNLIGLAWVLCVIVVLLRRGESLATWVKTSLAFHIPYRLGQGAVYALALAQEWTKPDGSPVRYRLDVLKDFGADMSPLKVFLMAGVMTSVIFTVISVVLWYLVWAIAFRRRSPVASDAAVMRAAFDPTAPKSRDRMHGA